MYDLPTAGLEQHASITPEERERLHQDVFGGEPDLAQDLFAPHPEPSCNADTSSTPARAAAPSAAAATISAAPPSASAATISAAPPSASATTVTGQDDYGQTVGRADETIGDLYRQKTSDAPHPRHHLAHHGDFLQVKARCTTQRTTENASSTQTVVVAFVRNSQSTGPASSILWVRILCIVASIAIGQCLAR